MEENDCFLGLPPETKQEESPLKKYTKAIIIASIIFCLSFMILFLAFTANKTEIKVNIETINIPELKNATLTGAHYLSDGKIFLSYNLTTNPSITNFAVVDDDGKNFKNIFSKEIKNRYPTTSGIRILPFSDNKRVLLGDYILECSQSLQNCSDADLIPLNFPEELSKENDSFRLWSEVVISQDCEHVSWTTLDKNLFSYNFLAKIKRVEKGYNMSNVQIISNSFNDGYNETSKILNIDTIRGGEVKQFVKGGLGLTLAGTDGMGLTKSVYQDLTSETVFPLSHEPGYEETSILSPDEQLGIAMSTRFSPKTNFAIIGLLPIPYSILATSSMIMNIYTYSVTDVRTSRKGNIGPVLFEVYKSKRDINYHGINLNTNENWNFESPISWHKSGIKAIWLESSKETETLGQKRIQKVNIKNYIPDLTVEKKTTPDDIKYAKNISEYGKDITELYATIIGKSGNITYSLKDGNVELEYNDYSLDGNSKFNGKMVLTKLSRLFSQELFCDVTATGSISGYANYTINMDDNLQFNWNKTKGSSSYNGKTIDVEIFKED